jgi:hypothetical protein
MMMEEEIDRTREEIKGIEEACEKVEEVLENVIQSRALNGRLDLLEDVTTQGEDGKMEDVQESAITTQPSSEIVQSDWFDDENLRSVWDGSGS